MTRCISLMFLVLSFGVIAAHSTTEQHNDDSSKETMILVLPLNEWTSQRVLTHVYANLLQQLDIPSSFQNIHSNDQWGAMRIGIIHAQIEVWSYSNISNFSHMQSKNLVLDMGTHQATMREEWWYPMYVKKLCPGLPDWQALNRCATLFAHGGTKGVYYLGPWEYGDAAMIRALSLNFTIERLADSQSVWRQLKQAAQQKQPIVLLNWSPNWVDVRMPGEFVEFPVFEKDCETKPEWGVNPELTEDCGNRQNGLLKKAAWPGLREHWPCAHRLLHNITLTNEMFAQASALVISDGHSEPDAAKHWQKMYPEQIAQWLAFDCQRLKNNQR